MRIGIIRTASSPCRCAESVSKGLESLGHDYTIVDSETVEFQSCMLAESCDLVLDHTDTYHGRGLYRPLVRILLENSGARVVGSDARACFLTDDKAAAKSRLREAGIPVPPGIVLRSKSERIPLWLKPPLVLKPSYEHMSRGVQVADTMEEAHNLAGQLIDSLKQPILVESFIPGRELAVSILDSRDGLRVLPVLEWDIGSDATSMLTEQFKLLDPTDEMHRFRKADLQEDLKHELEAFSLGAFRALGLRDYARLDVRLSSDGTPFFLEANTTPSLEPLEALAVSAEWAGFNYAALVHCLLSSAARRFEPRRSAIDNLIRIELPAGPVDLEGGESSFLPSSSSIELASHLDVQQGEEVLDIGCGSGLLTIAAAKLGAARVVAADLNPDALRAAEKNCDRNGVAARIEIRAGCWYEVLNTGSRASKPRECFDVIIATPPQTPGPKPFGPKYGGPDGTLNLFRILQGAPRFLKTEKGRLWIMAISLANPGQLWKRLEELFWDVKLVHQSNREFTVEEYEALESGLFGYLCSLRSSGLSDFVELEEGRFRFHNMIIRATGVRRL